MSHHHICSLNFSVQTVNGAAIAGEDYIAFDEDVVFEKNETVKSIFIEIVDDYEWEPDEEFHVKLCRPDVEHIALGNVSICTVLILNDDGKFVYIHFYERCSIILDQL